MKTFRYFESDEGGMNDCLVHSKEDLEHLYGWMSESTKKVDSEMVKWMDIAGVGECFNHRLGVLVRIKDSKPTTEGGGK